MPNKRAKNKKHFTASVEVDLFEAVEEYAQQRGLDRNSAVKELLWNQIESARIAETPDEYKVSDRPKKK